MAKETFQSTKPHVNVGTNTQILEDTAGRLTLTDLGSNTAGNPLPSLIITYSAPAPSTNATATVAFSVDGEFLFDPGSSGPAVSIDFQFDVLPTSVSGTSEVDMVHWQSANDSQLLFGPPFRQFRKRLQPFGPFLADPHCRQQCPRLVRRRRRLTSAQRPYRVDGGDAAVILNLCACSSRESIIAFAPQ